MTKKNISVGLLVFFFFFWGGGGLVLRIGVPPSPYPLLNTHLFLYLMGNRLVPELAVVIIIQSTPPSSLHSWYIPSSTYLHSLHFIQSTLLSKTERNPFLRIKPDPRYFYSQIQIRRFWHWLIPKTMLYKDRP